MEKVKQTDIRRARRFRNVHRFIDDLTMLNSGEDFEQSFKEIYTSKFVLQEENLSDNKGSVLDLFLKIENNQFSWSSMTREMTTLFLKQE